MRPLALRIHGEIRELQIGDRELPDPLLLLGAIKPDRETPPPPSQKTLFMRFCFVIQGIERPFMPAFVMDDWGNEVKKLSLFEWLYKDGDQYPRSEVFGFEAGHDGEWAETQRFVREFELGAKFPTFVAAGRADFPKKEDRIRGILFVNSDANVVQRIKAPTRWPMPLKRTNLPVWEVPPSRLADLTHLPAKL